MTKMVKKNRDGIFMGYVQKHGGGYIDNMFVLDAIKLTNAETTDEVHSDRVHEMEITVVKDVDGNFSVLSENWNQPYDGRKMTKRLLKKGDLVIPKKSKREGNSSLEGDEDEENSYDEKTIRTKKTKRAPNPPVASSGSEGESSMGDLSDADTEAAE